VYRSFGKRLLDLAVTVPALLLLSPVMALMALLVRLNLGSPVLFRHQRPGIGGRPFILLKFRTMTDARDTNGELLPDEQRITQFGQMLRHTSLDELPELINVLTGDSVNPKSLVSKTGVHINILTTPEWSRAIANPGMFTFFLLGIRS
jgi:sugar transferase EpsL